MTYIRDLDPKWSDPALDQPFRCTRCGWTGTWEDCEWATDADGVLGHVCPNCGAVEWEEVDR